MDKHVDNLTAPTGYEHFEGTVASLNRADLDLLAQAIHLRRVALMAESVKAAGFPVRIEGQGYKFNLLCVYPPDESGPGEWATLSEARRLLDTVRSLPPAQAFARWRLKIQPLQPDPYTESDAKRDMQAERAELKAQYEAGQINGEDLQIGWAAARQYLDLAK